MRDNFFFTIWPYVACALLMAGIAFRYVLARRQTSLLASEMAEAKTVFSGKLFWLSLVTAVIAHMAGLLLPRAVLSWNANPARLYLLEGFCFFTGLIALAACVKLVWQHLGRHGQSMLSEVCDTVFLALLFVVIVSGLLMAAGYRWGSSWGAMILTPYILSLLRGTPAVHFLAEMPFLVRLHVLSTFAAIAVLPLTRLATVLVVALDVSARATARPFAAAGNLAAAWVRGHNPGAWFWPEED